MWNFLKDFFVKKQTFTSTMGDLLGAAALVAAAPGVAESISATGKPWLVLGAAVVAYLGGAISGRTTKK